MEITFELEFILQICHVRWESGPFLAIFLLHLRILSFLLINTSLDFADNLLACLALRIQSFLQIRDLFESPLVLIGQDLAFKLWRQLLLRLD